MQFEQRYPILNVSVIEGSGKIKQALVSKGDHFILPYGFRKVNLSGSMELVISSVQEKTVGRYRLF